MEFESEASVILSPGARVVVGAPWLPLVTAAVVGLIMGLAVAAILARARLRVARRRWPHERSLGPELRMPGEYPDVETEL